MVLFPSARLSSEPSTSDAAQLILRAAVGANFDSYVLTAIFMADLLPVIEKLSALFFVGGSMLATGLRLAPQSLLDPLRDLRLVALAIGLNFVLAPAFAWLLAKVMPLDRGFAIGLLLLGGAAGAPFLPMLVEAAHGNLPLAAALLALLTAGTILFLPFALPMMLDGVEANPWQIAKPLLLLVAAPLAGGLVIRSSAPAFAQRSARVVAKIANVSLLLLFVLLVAKNFRSLLGIPGSGAVATTVFYTAGLFAAGWMVGGGTREIGGALGLATGARNFGAALVPAESIGGQKAVLMIVVAAIVTLILSFFAAGWMRRRADAIAV